MNCKQGDLAIVVRAPLGSVAQAGSIVRIVSFEGDCLIERPVVTVERDVWLIEFRGRTINDGYELSAPDADLRPIRDNPGNESFFKAAPITELTKEKA